MSEERFDRIEKMMAQLNQMVGHNNAVTEELRQDVSGLKEDVIGLKQDMVDIDAKMEKGFADIVTMVNVLGRTTHQEAEIQGLKRAK